MDKNGYFSDIDVEAFGFGGLGGVATESHHRATAKPTKEGVVMAFNCDNCGMPNRLTADWNEIIQISAGAIPQGWVFDAGYVRPYMGCAHCRKEVKVGITPDEAKRHVTAAINARFVDPNYANALVQKARSGVR